MPSLPMPPKSESKRLNWEGARLHCASTHLSCLLTLRESVRPGSMALRRRFSFPRKRRLSLLPGHAVRWRCFLRQEKGKNGVFWHRELPGQRLRISTSPSTTTILRLKKRLSVFRFPPNWQQRCSNGPAWLSFRSTLRQQKGKMLFGWRLPPILLRELA